MDVSTEACRDESNRSKASQSSSGLSASSSGLSGFTSGQRVPTIRRSKPEKPPPEEEEASFEVSCACHPPNSPVKPPETPEISSTHTRPPRSKTCRNGVNEVPAMAFFKSMTLAPAILCCFQRHGEKLVRNGGIESQERERKLEGLI